MAWHLVRRARGAGGRRFPASREGALSATSRKSRPQPLRSRGQRRCEARHFAAVAKDRPGRFRSERTVQGVPWHSRRARSVTGFPQAGGALEAPSSPWGLASALRRKEGNACMDHPVAGTGCGPGGPRPADGQAGKSRERWSPATGSPAANRAGLLDLCQGGGKPHLPSGKGKEGNGRWQAAKEQ